MALNSLYCADVPLSNYSLTWCWWGCYLVILAVYKSGCVYMCVYVCVCVCVGVWVGVGVGVTDGVKTTHPWFNGNTLSARVRRCHSVLRGAVFNWSVSPSLRCWWCHRWRERTAVWSGVLGPVWNFPTASWFCVDDSPLTVDWQHINYHVPTAAHSSPGQSEHISSRSVCNYWWQVGCRGGGMPGSKE